MISPPRTEAELLSRARDIAGLNLANLAGKLDIPVPDHLGRGKGWVGELIEKSLGGNAGNQSEPDFMHLGIELKTLPLTAAGTPQESTFVCSASLINPPGHCWENSVVKKKLDYVLWVPVEADHAIPVPERKIGSPVLWRLTTEQSRILEQDWNEIMDHIRTGQLDKISATSGRFLQLRPKAANAKTLCDALDADGNRIRTLPRGFYLRTVFTAEILKQAYLQPGAEQDR
ncbi:MAG: DNA mismatch repair endonuclease MutH [Thiotrichales bacterium]|nr:DNA mismatch repair endonuclease MutH [Thiotrichales bacterium]